MTEKPENHYKISLKNPCALHLEKKNCLNVYSIDAYLLILVKWYFPSMLKQALLYIWCRFVNHLPIAKQILGG